MHSFLGRSEMQSDDIVGSLFRGDPGEGGQQVWMGDYFSAQEGQEVWPFRVKKLRYLFQFASPVSYAGNQETVASSAVEWMDGFVPHPESRFIKFHRAEASDPDTQFLPEEWPLDDKSLSIRLFRLLGMMVKTHAETFPDVQQYFYIPSTGKLAKAYDRLYTSITSKGYGEVKFTPIQENLGDFYGYERNKNG